MATVHEVINDNEEIRKKVAFFFDYFHFSAETMGLNDLISMDNPLTLTRKIIYQIENNPKYCVQYVDSYLTNSWLREDHQYYKNVVEFISLHVVIKQYSASSNRDKWVKRNAQVILDVLRKFEQYLDKNMFENALGGIISYFKCSHHLHHHLQDYINLTNCIVSEFIINNRSRKDLKDIFYRVLNKDGENFPFPPSMSDNDEDAKKRFIQNRTFDEQFYGINTIFKQEPRIEYFLYTVRNLEVPDDFKLEYNKVILISPRHNDLVPLSGELERGGLGALNFFKSADLIVATRLEFYSIDEGAMEALDTIRADLKFVNVRLGINCLVDPFRYITTTEDMHHLLGLKSDHKYGLYTLEETDLFKLNDNIYSNLSGIDNISKKEMLDLEPQYIDALSSKRTSMYWVYLEALIPLDGNGEKQVVEIVSSLLLLNAEYYHKEKLLKNYVWSCLVNSNSRVLGMSKENYKKHIVANGKLSMSDLQKDSNNPFLDHLLNEYLTAFPQSQLADLKGHYNRILKDAYGDRNATFHSGMQNPKVKKALELSFTRLVTRLRWVIFEGMRRYNGRPFEEIITKLKDESDSLIRRGRHR